MKLFLLLLFWSTSTKALPNTTEDINIRIGAGYGVGLGDGFRLPKSTTKILHSTTNTLSEILSREAQHRRPKAIIEPEPAESVQHIQIEPQKTGHNMKDIQRIVDGLEHDKYSKIVQVVKVPAVYEIHLQTEVKSTKSKPEGNQRIRNIPRYPKVRYHRDQRHSPHGKRVNSRGLHSEGRLRTGRNPQQTNRILQRKSAPEAFSHNQQIMDPEHPPQAMYEVPAPSLGNNQQHHTSTNTKNVRGSNFNNQQLDRNPASTNTKTLTDLNMNNLQLDWKAASTYTKKITNPSLKTRQRDWGRDNIITKNTREDTNFSNHQLEWNQATESIAEPNLNNQQLSWTNADNIGGFSSNSQQLDWSHGTFNQPQSFNFSTVNSDVKRVGDPKLDNHKPAWSSVDSTAHALTDPNFTDHQLDWNPNRINTRYSNLNNQQPMWSSIDTNNNEPRDQNPWDVPRDPQLVWNSVNLYSTLTPAVPYELGNKNGNLVYGRAFEPVKAPAVLAADDPGNPDSPERRRDNGVDVGQVFFTTERSHGGFSDRISRNGRGSKPVGYSIYTRISERYVDGSDRK